MKNHNNLDYNFNYFRTYSIDDCNNNIIIKGTVINQEGRIVAVGDFFINNPEMCFIFFRDCSHFENIFLFNKKSESEEVFIIENY